MEKINPRARDAPYLQVARILQGRILQGLYPPDERIPSESELMSEFEIGRTTARKAVAWLREQELVETDKGRGTFVKKDLPPRRQD